MQPLLELVDISKSFEEKILFEKLSAVFFEKSTSYICGPSGSGKSTLLSIIAGLINPDTGTRFASFNTIGYSFQHPTLLPWFSAEQNLDFALRNKITNTDLRKEIIKNGLARFKIIPQRFPNELSGGEKARVNLLRAFLIEPELLILDEPFSFQSNEFSNLIAETITKSLQKQTAIIIATHAPLELDIQATNVIELGSHS